MSLRYAILGLLTRESLTGYELTKRFDSSINHFWPAKHSQIYPELASLTQEGLVTFELVTQTSKPNKKVYTITAEGRESLCEWLKVAPERRTVKDPLLLKVWPVGQMAAGPARQALREAIPEWEKRLQERKGFEAELIPLGINRVDASNPNFGIYMALRWGIMHSEAYLEWLRWAVAQLEAIESSQAPVPAQP